MGLVVGVELAVVYNFMVELVAMTPSPKQAIRQQQGSRKEQ